jgi:hypothetical protein
VVEGPVAAIDRSVGDHVGKGVQQESDPRRSAGSRAGGESPHLRSVQVLLNAVPLGSSLVLTLDPRQQQRLDQLGVGQRNASDVEAGEEGAGIELGRLRRLVPDHVNGLGQCGEELDRGEGLVLLLAEPGLDALEGLVHVEVVDVLDAGRLGGGGEVRRDPRPGVV